MQNNYTCIIVDDEQDAIELLESRLLKLYSNITIVATFMQWQTALNALRTTQCDLLMMDISIPGKTGINMLKLVPDIESEIIFVTAHDNYALEAFELSASGYILKPVDDEELKQAVDKALERISHKKHAATPPTITLKPNQINEKMAIPNNHGIDYINIRDIMYLESVNKCTKIITANGDEYTTTNNIGKYQYLIDNFSFFQIHRSFVINLNNVLRYESSGVIVMSDKKEIPISRSVRSDFLKLLDLE